MTAGIKHLVTNHLRFITAVIAAVLCLSACGHPGLKDSAENVIQAGATIDGMRNGMKKLRTVDPQVWEKIWEKPSYYLTRNGNAVYVEPIYGYEVFGQKKYYIDCDYHWEVNPQGRVVGYLTVGPKCTWYRGRNDTDPRLIEGATTPQQPR